MCMKPWQNKRASQFSSTLRSPLLFIALSFFCIIFFFSYYHFMSPKSLPSSISSSSSSTSSFEFLNPDSPRCPITSPERFLYYAPHSGFSNQLSEFKNALIIAGILNRTVVVPPILDHHAVALGSCPKFRVSDPGAIRVSVWDHAVELIRDGRYVSILDIIDVSSLVSSATVRVIDFRVFASQLCNLDVNSICVGDSEEKSSLLESLQRCGSLLSGIGSIIDKCLYTVNEDCRTTVWTYQSGDEDGSLDLFQPSEELKRRKKISYIRKRLDIQKSLGPGSEADAATVLAFGSLFSSPYKGSESHIDIHESLSDRRIQNLIEKTEFLPFVTEITVAGKRFAHETIQAPFLCAQLRLLDGQFKNHWETTFQGLKQKIESLGESSHPVHIFVMTDLPEANWTGSYLGDLAGDSRRFKLFFLKEKDKLVTQTARKLVDANQGLSFKFLSKGLYGDGKIHKHCRPLTLPDILLYIEETVCSCASLGFAGTSGSTMAESIESMRKFGVCSNSK